VITEAVHQSWGITAVLFCRQAKHGVNNKYPHAAMVANLLQCVQQGLQQLVRNMYADAGTAAEQAYGFLDSLGPVLVLHDCF
jgi:hypothetical protein